MTVISEGAQRLCLPPLLESGAAMRHAIGQMLERLGAGPEEAADMMLAASEAFNNAVGHGGMGNDDQLLLAIEGIGTEIVVTLDYRGAPFPVLPPTLPETTQPHGRGRYLMERMTDSVSYLFEHECTRVELRKQVRGH